MGEATKNPQSRQYKGERMISEQVQVNFLTNKLAKVIQGVTPQAAVRALAIVAAQVLHQTHAQKAARAANLQGFVSGVGVVMQSLQEEEDALKAPTPVVPLANPGDQS